MRREFDSQQLLPSCFSLLMAFENEYWWFDFHFDYKGNCLL